MKSWKIGTVITKELKDKTFGSTEVELKYIVEAPVKCAFCSYKNKYTHAKTTILPYNFAKWRHTIIIIQCCIELETADQNVATITTSPVDYSF